MTTQRAHRSIVYRCDKPGCKGMHVAPYTDFKLGWANARAAGWVGAKMDGKFFVFCDWVHRMKDEELKILAST